MIVATAMAFLVGCDKLPTPEKMTSIANLVGKTAGYVCELSKIKPEAKEAIFNVLDIVSKATPTNGETFVEAWTPIIDVELKKLVDAGKINEATAAVAKITLGIAADGIDYVFVKYPKAKDVENLVAAATTGFINGFKSVVALAADGKPELDEDAYKYLKSKLKN